MPHVPFTPQPLEALQARWPAAFEKVYSLESAAEDRPGLHEENVFGFDDGFRIICSRDTNGTEIYRHFSASITSEAVDNFIRTHRHKIYCFPTQLLQTQAILKEVVLAGWDHIRALSLASLPQVLAPKTISDALIPHWFIEQ